MFGGHERGRFVLFFFKAIMKRNLSRTELLSRYSDGYYTLKLYIFLNLLYYILTFGEPVNAKM